MHKMNKVLFSVLATVLCGFGVFVGTVDASIKETTDVSNTTYDHIANGTTVIGVTKFSPSTIITAKRASQATMNDVAYNLNNPYYAGVHIYYYFYGWYEFDENNNSNPVADASTLNELNIFYIDNVEKKLEIPYAGSTSNLSFKTDKANKDREVRYADGIISVPATVNKLTVFSNNSKTAAYAKANESDMAFLENPTTGNLIAIDNSIKHLSFDSALTFDGHIPFVITEDDGIPNGNYITVGIGRDNASYQVPTVEDREKITFLVKDASNPDGTLYTWGNDNSDAMRQLNLLFTDEMRDASITVTWEKGNTEVFNVNLTKNSTLGESPRATIFWDKKTGVVYDSNDEPDDFTFDVLNVPDYIFFTGKIAYDTATSSHRVGITITPNEKYKNANENSIVIETVGAVTGDTAVPEWVTDSYGNKVITYVPMITETDRVINVKVTWEKGFTQIFTIDTTTATLWPAEVTTTE